MKSIAAFLIHWGSLALAAGADGESSTQRIALLGCIRQFEPAPALVQYIEAEPDLFLWLGDNIYADTEDDPKFIEECYAALQALPAFRILRNDFDYLATWDDHDYGLNDAGKEYALKAQSRQLFREFWGLQEQIPVDRAGVYYSRIIDFEGHQLQIIMLDPRYNRDEPSPSGDTLGEEQWAWLADELSRPADLRLIVSGYQILLDADSGSETWELFPLARERLFQTIRDAAAERVLFITGDQHYGEVARLRNALDFDAVEFQFSGINQIEAPELNRYRVSQVSQSLHSYALIDIQWRENESHLPHLLFRVFDARTQQVEVAYRLNFSELELELQAPESTIFIESKTIELRHSYKELQARYTLDGTRPTKQSSIYEGPITINSTARLSAALFQPDGNLRGAFIQREYQQVAPIPATSVDGLSLGLSFHYYEGEFERLPNFSELSPLRSGIAKTIELAAANPREDHYAIRFEGYFDAPETGVYVIRATSDDGMKLFIADRLLIDNDGSHSASAKRGEIALEKGLHPIRVDYFEDYLGQRLDIQYSVDDSSFRKLESERLFH